MRNKKVGLLAVILGMMVLFLTACGGAGGGGKEGKNEANKQQEKFPIKPITLVVPFSAGGISDTLARAIAETSKKYLDQPINVVDQPGGSGTVGTNQVVTSKPDGYTLLLGSSGELASGLHLVKAPYGLDSYTPLCQIGWMRVVLATRKDAPWKSLKDFIEYAKKNPEKVSVGVPGTGSVVALTGYMFCQQVGIKLNFVPFQGSGPLVPALLGGHVDVALLNVPEISSQFKAGEANILVVFSDERVEAVKDVPTAKEQGYDVSGGASHFIVGPNGIPEEIAKVIRGTIKKVVSDPKFIETTNQLGYQLKYAETAESKEFLKKWYETAGEIYKKLGMVQQ